MTTTGEELGGRARQRPSGHEPSRSALRVSGIVRLGVAALVGGGLTAGLIVAMWGPLHVKATVLGYPLFYDFNPYNYSRGYELAVVLFPLLTLAIFYGLTWLGPRMGLPTPPPRGRIRPTSAQPVPDRPLAPITGHATRRGLATAAQLVFVGVVLGLEVGIAAGHLWPGIALTAAGYCVAAAAAAALVSRLARVRPSFEVALQAVNSVGTALPIAGLVLASAHTELTVTAGQVSHAYPWCPLWVALPLAAVVAGGIVFALRRVGWARTQAVERWTVPMVAAPVALFLLTTRLPGDLGQLGLFEEGQQATEAMLVGHGWLPWRDVFLTHGLLGDVAPMAAGWGVFGNSYWGGAAGFFFLLDPIAIVTTYLLTAYLVRRVWPVLFIAGLLFLDTWFGLGMDPRYGLWPIALLLLAAMLRHPRRWLAIGLGLLLVAQAIVSNEMLPCIPIALVVVAAYEWYWRASGVAWRAAFDRTIWLAGATIVGIITFVVYMGARGALGAVIFDTLAVLPGHTLDGGNPPIPIPGTPEPVFLFVTLAPVGAVLISMAYVVIYLRLRRPFELADWPMAASAVFVFFYYTKFLARMDMGHAYQVFSVALPLMLYIVYRAVVAVDHWVRSRPALPRMRWTRWMPAYPVAVALLAYFLIAFWGPLTARVKATPSAYRPTSPVPVQVKRVGYSSDVDVAAIHDLRRILDAYLGPHGRVFDFTNEPGLFYYFLNREPTTSWFAPNGLNQTPQLQNKLIGDLRRDKPKLIVFDDTDTQMYGLEAMDGIPVSSRLYLVSRWILDHYTPLLESHKRVIYALPSVRRIPVDHLHLEQPPLTRGIRFQGQSCLWGDSPTFLDGPAQPRSGAASVPARIVARYGPSVTFTGWAGDRRARRPAREVIATLDGRIVARTRPNIARPDVPQHGYPAGFLRSGFLLSVPFTAAPPGLRLFAIGRDGSVAQLPMPGQAPQQGTVKIAGRSVSLRPNADVGSVDTEVASGAYVKIAPPAGGSWAHYRWLQVDAPAAGFVAGQFTLADIAGASAETYFGHLIAFSTIASSPHHYVIPTASCQQWRGYGSRSLYLHLPAGQPGLASVRLIR